MSSITFNCNWISIKNSMYNYINNHVNKDIIINVIHENKSGLESIVYSMYLKIVMDGITKEYNDNIVLFHRVNRGHISGIGFTLFYPHRKPITFGPYHRGKMACLEFTKYGEHCLKDWECYYKMLIDSLGISGSI